MAQTLPSEKKALNRAAQILGGQAALASILGYSDRRNVSPWFTTDRQFPAEHCPTIERETRAAGDVVTCEELRPDVAWDVLREQVAAAEPEPVASTPKPHTKPTADHADAKAGDRRSEVRRYADKPGQRERRG